MTDYLKIMKRVDGLEKSNDNLLTTLASCGRGMTYKSLCTVRGVTGRVYLVKDHDGKLFEVTNLLTAVNLFNQL